MSAPHIEDDLLDQYASGSVRRESLPALEEHLLICPDCQTRLIATDEFIGLFRAAATQPDARPQPLSGKFLNARVLSWAGAAAMAGAVLFISVELQKPPVAAATVFMHALRGPEASAAVSAGKPFRLVFDLTPTGAAQDYEVQVVNLSGTEVLAAPVELNNGHLSVVIKKLGQGSYWVRLYQKENHQPIVEYGLHTE